MSIKSVIENTPSPRTRASLAADLRRLGLKSGMTVIVHSSLSSIGWVSGGPVAVVQALMDVVTKEGTIVMPTHSFQNADHLSESWYDQIRETMPAYDPRITPTVSMGTIVETFRTFPFVERSSHPLYSMAAWGRNAKVVAGHQALDYGMGEDSPLARVYNENGWVLFIGTGYHNNTSFHLGEIRSGVRKNIQYGSPIIENGRRVWKIFVESDVNSDCFDQIGAEFEINTPVKNGKVGSAPSKLFSQCKAVDFSKDWFLQNIK